MRSTAWWLCAALLAMPAAQAREEPLWELGMGGAMMTLPDYRGSDEGQTYFLPIPYFAYNGERFRIDRSGAHGDIAKRENVVLEVSMNLGPPADSEHNRARVGMPDLDPTIEIGPSLKILWAENAQRDRTVTLYLPVRGVIATDFSDSQGIGWVFAPHLTVEQKNFGPGGGWNFSASLGPIYGSERYHDYYYEVRPEFATTERPAYSAGGGYSGARSTLTLSKRFKDYWVGAFVRYDNLSNVTFEDSPLLRRNSSLMAGIGMSWIFARSKESAPERKTAD